MKLVVPATLLVLLTSGVVYGLITAKYTGEIDSADEELNLIGAEIIMLTKQPTVSSPAPTPGKKETDIYLSTELCYSCHSEQVAREFHFPEAIKEIDEKRGKPVRICTTCHGEPVMPVHFRAVQEKKAVCEACHIQGNSGFIVPEKREDDLLICQLCHARGSYIRIHIDGAILEDAEIDSKWIKKRDGNQCTVCHNEDMYQGSDILAVHSSATASAGQIKDGGDRLTTAQNVTAEWGTPTRPTLYVELN